MTHAYMDDFAAVLTYTQTVILDDLVRVDQYTTQQPRGYRSVINQGYRLKQALNERAHGSMRLTPKTTSTAIHTTDVYTVQTRTGVVITAADGDRLYPLLTVTDLTADDLRVPGVLERLIGSRLIQEARTKRRQPRRAAPAAASAGSDQAEAAPLTRRAPKTPPADQDPAADVPAPPQETAQPPAAEPTPAAGQTQQATTPPVPETPSGAPAPRKPRSARKNSGAAQDTAAQTEVSTATPAATGPASSPRRARRTGEASADPTPVTAVTAAVSPTVSAETPQPANQPRRARRIGEASAAQTPAAAVTADTSEPVNQPRPARQAEEVTAAQSPAVTADTTNQPRRARRTGPPSSAQPAQAQPAQAQPAQASPAAPASADASRPSGRERPSKAAPRPEPVLDAEPLLIPAVSAPQEPTPEPVQEPAQPAAQPALTPAIPTVNEDAGGDGAHMSGTETQERAMVGAAPAGERSIERNFTPPAPPPADSEELEDLPF